jgi:transposase
LITDPLLSLLPGGLAIDRVEVSSGLVTVHARSCDLIAHCPICATPSGRLHGRYIRHVADLPLMGRVVSLSLQIRRFRCPQSGCPRRIFAERLPTAAPFRKRRTARLADVQRSLALATGGEPGSRLAGRLAMPVSGDTLLRLVRAVPIEPAPPARVIGIDDWAWRRGQRYGTIIVDLERNRPIDLLPDRQGDTVAAWLKDHPGVEIVARDRAGAYADGIRTGAPDAIQVSDRWHLLRNLNDAVARALDRHHRDLRAATAAATETGAVIDAPPSATAAPELSSKPVPELSHPDRHAVRRARFDEVMALHHKGWPIKRIARTLGLNRKMVRRWLRSDQLPTWNQRPRGSAVDVHAEYLRQRWNEGCHNAAQLWQEIRRRGFRGQLRTVQRWVRRLWDADPSSSGTGQFERVWKMPSKRRAAWLVVADAETIDATEQRFVEALIATSSELGRIIELARAFSAMVRYQQAEQLDAWLAAAKDTALAGFADGLVRDLAAIRAALSLPWSTGPVEGQISYLKTIKRTMSGRAGFDLLRHRVLEAA